MKRLLITAAVALICVVAGAQQHVSLSVGEYFMGLSAGHGHLMPVGDKAFSISADDNVNGNLTSPLMVSTTGRYVFTNKPLQVSSARGAMVIPEGCEVQSAGTSLRQAFLVAVSKLMKPDGKLPPEEFFNAPVYNTWSALGSRLSQATVEEYASDILACGLKPGIIVIDNGWQGHNGSFEFDIRSFPNPAQLVSWLHSKGMKVMLQVTPMISPDCLDFMEFKKSGRLEKNEKGLPKIVEWYGGYSAMLDMSNPENSDYIKSSIDEIISKYGIDGFKFDFVHQDDYTSTEDYLARIKPWTQLASGYKYHIISGAYKSDGTTVIGQLNYRVPSWSSLPLMLAEAINAGMTGYPFVVPQPAGGDFALSDDGETADPDFFVRSVQLQAFMPTMHFSVPSSEKLSDTHKRLVKEAVEFHESLLPYIKELAASAVQSGEPLIHPMEYNFPGKGLYDCKDQFMLGSRYLVAPVMNSEGERTVRLPAGIWTDDTGKRYKGPAVLTVKVPIDRILYFTAAKEPKVKKSK